MITRVNLASWAVGDKLTSAQMNGLDLNTTYALDKRAGQTDSLGSRVQCSGAGRMVRTVFVAPDANTNIVVSAGRSVVILNGSITASRTYTLKNTDAILGDTVVFKAFASYPGSVVVKNDAGVTLGTVAAWAIDSATVSELEAFFDGTQWVTTALLGNVEQVFTSPAVWTCPVTGLYMINMWGGGGGGGGGSSAFSATNSWTCGGGGGGGALQHIAFEVLTAGTAYTGTPGDGGAGGATETDGENGEDSMFVGGSVVRIAPGAGPGRAGYGVTTTDTMLTASIGGAAVSMNEEMRVGWGSYDGGLQIEMADAAWSPTTFIAGYDISAGGCGTAHNSARSASGFVTGYGRGNSANSHGGEGGDGGIDSGSYRGGGGGGGGGAGPAQILSATATGGDGGNASNAGAGSSGAAGLSPPANSGWGGGGGGGGGSGSSVGAPGGAGAAGASGRISIIRLR